MKIEFEIDNKIVEYLRHAFTEYRFTGKDNNKLMYLLIMDHYVRLRGEENDKQIRDHYL